MENAVDKKELKSWIRNNPSMKKLAFQLNGLVVVLISTIWWEKKVNPEIFSYIYDALIIYFVVLLVLIFRVNRRLRAKFFEATPANPGNGDCINLDKKSLKQTVFQKYFTVLSVIAFVALIGVRLFGDGEGLDAKLDASRGYDVAYHASLSKAFNKMTSDQQKTYNWVVQNISEGEFISLYGKRPKVREVITGQLDKWESFTLKSIEAQQQLVAKKSEENQARKELQKKAIELLGSITVTGKLMPSPDEKRCKGIACINVSKAVISYTVKDPNNLDLAVMPCLAYITPKNSDVDYKYTLPCQHPGSFNVSIDVPDGVSFKEAKLEFRFNDNEARTQGWAPAIPEDIDEVLQLKKLEGNISEIKNNRKFLHQKLDG